MVIREYLREFEFFKKNELYLNDNDFVQLVQNIHYKHLPKGEVLFEEGE
jgi:hypothetical protein